MSLRPAIGKEWIWKNWKEVYLARDGIVRAGGKLSSAPRYYDKQLNSICSATMTNKETERILRAKEREADNTEQRLKTKELIAIENLKRKQRKLI